MTFDFDSIWIGDNYPESRVLVLGESWYGSWDDDTDAGYVRLYLAGRLPRGDAMYTRMANAVGMSKHAFWHRIAFTNFVQRVGDARSDRPTAQHYLDAAPRLRALAEYLTPSRVWVLGKGQGEYSSPVLKQAGVLHVVSRHPTAYGVPNAELKADWDALLKC